MGITDIRVKPTYNPYTGAPLVYHRVTLEVKSHAWYTCRAVDGDLLVPQRAEEMGRDRQLGHVPTRDARCVLHRPPYSCLPDLPASEPMGIPPDVRVLGWGLSLERPTMIKYVVNCRTLSGLAPHLPGQVWYLEHSRASRPQSLARQHPESRSSSLLELRVADALQTATHFRRLTVKHSGGDLYDGRARRFQTSVTLQTSRSTVRQPRSGVRSGRSMV